MCRRAGSTRAQHRLPLSIRATAVPAKKANTDKGFLLRIDAETMEMVERWAADEFRSVNGQLQWIINDALTRHKRKKSHKKSE